MDRKLIDDYEDGGELLIKSIDGLNSGELRALPSDGSWSIQQIVIHMLDSDLVGADRIKRVIAEDNPSLLAYDESAFTAKLFYQEADPKLACDIFRLNRIYLASILRRLPDSSFARIGQHSETGQKTLQDLVHNYVDHLDHHLKFITKKRANLGKPVSA